MVLYICVIFTNKNIKFDHVFLEDWSGSGIKQMEQTSSGGHNVEVGVMGDGHSRTCQGEMDQ